MNPPPFDAIIFDHDGTLIDTESPDFEACKLLFEEVGLPLNIEYWAETAVGQHDGYYLLFDQVIAAGNGKFKGYDQVWQRLKALWNTTFQNVELMPGVRQLIHQLDIAGFPLAIATASKRAWVDRWLGPHNILNYFQVVATSDNITHNKPAPDVYLYAATQLNVHPERCLVFEDSVAGMQSAKAAGMTVVAVPNHITKSLDFSQADAVVDNLTTVTIDWLNQFGNGNHIQR